MRVAYQPSSKGFMPIHISVDFVVYFIDEREHEP